MFGNLSRLLLILLLTAVGQALDTPTARAREDVQGFLYGTVTTESGNTYVGFLRWNDEEAFWDDLFHSAKKDLEWGDRVPDGEHRRDRKRTEIKVFDWSVHVEGSGSWPGSRMFIARFGDIARLDPHGDDGARVTMRGGDVHEVEGASNDVGGKVVVDDTTMGRIELRWDRIESIVFAAAPRDTRPPAWRLHGRVMTFAGDYEGYIQWDKQECLSTDRLDGDTDDGDVSLAMGQIRSIERRGKRASLVKLKDGRELRLSGSNDVNSDNRGIMVEDARFGRVTVDWGAFDRIEFADPGSSGRGFDDFTPQGRLRGTVTDASGQTHRGFLVLDLDEAYGWEILNGTRRDVDYDIPLFMVQRIERVDEEEARIVLRSGESLELSDGQDVTDRNAGVLILAGEDDREPHYLAWEDVRSIAFD